MRRKRALVLLLLALVTASACRERLRRACTPAVQRLRGRATVVDRLAEFGPAARRRWTPYFGQAQMAYPPDRVVLVGLKRERRLEVYASGGGEPCFVHSYRILGASGGPGPKLREGDLQVPEGVYPVESLNPNSAFHLALRLGYPNQFDRATARREGREELGSDIMIHGGSGSVGCLAMGDEAAEDLFTLAADTGVDRLRVILSPHDFRARPALPPAPSQPDWVRDLYQGITSELRQLPLPPR